MQIGLVFGVLLICSLYVFDKLNRLTHYLLNKYEKRKKDERN